MQSTLSESKSHFYLPFKDVPDHKLEPSPTTRIEEVLVYINSHSWRFQTKVLLVQFLLFFAIGVHVFTFVYFFLTPGFVSASDPRQGKVSQS